MKSKFSLKIKLTAISICILTIMCVVLAVFSIFSAGKLIESTDTIPAIPVGENQTEQIIESAAVLPAEAIGNFQGTMIVVMLCLVALGSVLTYVFASKTLKPLEDLTVDVQNINVNNLSQQITVPSTKDEVAELALAFQRMMEKLNQSYQIQKRFSANAAHELRTPLAALQTQLEVFQMKPNREKEEYETLFQSVGESTERLSNLVKDLLTFTNEQTIERREPVELRDLIEEIRFELEDSAAERGIKIHISGQGVIIGDDRLLQRAFYNLLSNAIRYNTDGGTISVDISDSKVMVEDTGIGIPDEAKAHIFEAFFCVDKSRSRELGGSGLGLAVVKSIIEKHGGEIRIENNDPQGSRFVVTFH